MKQPNASQVIIDELGIGEKVTAIELMNLMKEEWDSEVENIKLLPGAEKLVRHLKQNKIPISISTGSSDSSFALKTKNFKIFSSYLILLSSVDRIRKLKVVNRHLMHLM